MKRSHRILLREDSFANVIRIIPKHRYYPERGNKGLIKLLKFLKFTHQIAEVELEARSLGPNFMFFPLAEVP